jgi:hypothetical protein
MVMMVGWLVGWMVVDDDDGFEFAEGRRERGWKEV